MSLKYDRLEEQLTTALPEIRPAAERYWGIEGTPGEDCGNYIFFENMFAKYVEVLLAMESSPGRDRLLRRAFRFVEAMLASNDEEVANLAYVGLLEWRPAWWYVRASAFLGPGAKSELDRHGPAWRLEAASGASPSVQEKDGIYDFYGVRSVIISELAYEGIAPEAVPGGQQGMGP